MGETESDQGPVDFGSGERARHGRCAPVFRAKRDRVATKAQERRVKHDFKAEGDRAVSGDPHGCGEVEQRMEQLPEQPPRGRRFIKKA